jgi:hypothetical protein
VVVHLEQGQAQFSNLRIFLSLIGSYGMNAPGIWCGGTLCGELATSFPHIASES